MGKEQVIIQQIHDAFDGAQDTLLKEAEEITKENLVDNTSHIKKMVELGFTSSKKVQEASKKMEAATKNARKAKLILKYKEKYPFLKFLTVEKLNEICEKYNLVHAPVENYIEDVPEKNLIEIANAQELDVGDALHDDVKNVRENGRTTTTRTVKAGLFIAAPENQFNLDGLTKKGVRGFFKEVVTSKVDDPIVFRYVKGGIQVLSKWGLEANDPDLANPLDN